jgi:RNA polymerase sigma factor, sigma-70 family
MDSRQIENYVKSHSAMIDRAVSSIPVKLTREEREDASQELYIKMIHCLRNYNPARKTPVDNYVGVSLFRWAQRIGSSYYRGSREIENFASSLDVNVYHDGESERVANIIEDESTPFDEYIDSKLLTEDLLSQLKPFTRAVIVSWSEGMGLWAISEKYGYSLKWVYTTLEKGLAQMRKMVDTKE